MLSLDDAIATLLAAAQPVKEVEIIAIQDSLGRIVADDVLADVDVPAFDQSAMDGYAISANLDSLPEHLPVVTRIAAGQTSIALPIDAAARIFTGAPTPEGTTAVVMQEHVTAMDNHIMLTQPVQAGQYIRRRGEDIAAGQIVVNGGTRLDAGHIGLLASIGVAAVKVKRAISVAILSTGDELLEPGEAPTPAGVYNSNRYALRALLQKAGCKVIDIGKIADDAAITRNALTRAAAQADLIISTGGVSVGEEDHVKAAVEATGSLQLWKVAIKPGKPLAFGRIANTPFIGLPGNPVSAFVTYLLCARPFIQQLQGYNNRDSNPILVVANFDWPRPDMRREFLRARLITADNGETCAILHPNQGSGAMLALAWADGLVEIPPQTVVQPGERVRFWPLHQLLD